MERIGEVEKKLGKGTSGDVYLCRRKNRKVAVKVVSIERLRSKQRKDRLVREIEILKTIRHDFIVEFEDLQWDAKNVYIIMEYCNVGNLKSFISRTSSRRLGEQESRYFLRQLVSGVLTLHDSHIIHRDLKTENLLLVHLDGMSRPILKISDFGISHKQDDSTDATGSGETVGTLQYTPPEVLKKHRPVNEQSDLWAVGIIFYEMLEGLPPFASARNLDELLKSIVAESPDPVPYPKAQSLSNECKDMLDKLLQRDPLRRSTAHDLRENSYLDLEYVPGPMSEAQGMSSRDEAVRLKALARTDEDRKKVLSTFTTAIAHLLSALELVGTDGVNSTKYKRLRSLIDQTLEEGEQFRASYGIDTQSKPQTRSSYWSSWMPAPATSWLNPISQDARNGQAPDANSTGEIIVEARSKLQAGQRLAEAGAFEQSVEELTQGLSLLFELISLEKTESATRTALETEMKNWLEYGEEVKKRAKVKKEGPKITIAYQNSALNLKP
ncbi:Serine/threonine-protein kinase ulk3 [Phlyctochytrium planicorne]|nr:Serine/threonine-protein kinase ulk3 [Phlyctochytrium planicorne]